MNKNKYMMFLLLLTACGVNNPYGFPGPVGPSGIPGQAGAVGQTGLNGTSCTVTTIVASLPAPNGGSLIQCQDGTQSLVLNGLNGAVGQTGAAGINGTNGTNGTLVTPIQFCKGTGSYPSTFPEVGFCINNNLYAVYSANGGFLTEVLPGTWSSDGINSSCTFTVAANCQVSN